MIFHSAHSPAGEAGVGAPAMRLHGWNGRVDEVAESGNMSDFAIGVLLAVVGIAIAIVLGLRATKSRSQRQTSKSDSISIQSGRDTNIGPQ